MIHGPTAGRNWEATSARRQLSRTAAAAGVRRRFAPDQLRHLRAIELAHEEISLVVIQRQLGHAHLGVTSVRSCRRVPLRRVHSGLRPAFHPLRCHFSSQPCTNASVR